MYNVNIVDINNETDLFQILDMFQKCLLVFNEIEISFLVVQHYLMLITIHTMLYIRIYFCHSDMTKLFK